MCIGTDPPHLRTEVRPSPWPSPCARDFYIHFVTAGGLVRMPGCAPMCVGESGDVIDRKDGSVYILIPCILFCQSVKTEDRDAKGEKREDGRY